MAKKPFDTDDSIKSQQTPDQSKEIKKGGNPKVNSGQNQAKDKPKTDTQTSEQTNPIAPQQSANNKGFGKSILEGAKKILSHPIVIGLYLTVIVAVFLFVIGEVWLKSVEIKYDRVEYLDKTYIPYLETRDSENIAQATSVARTLESIKQTLVATTPPPTPTLLISPLLTDKPIQNPWTVTEIDGFNNDIKFEEDFKKIYINQDKMGSNKGFIYLPITGINSMDFYLKVIEFPNLADVEYKMVDSERNYQLTIGVSDQTLIKEVANNHNFIQAKIYPILTYNVSQNTTSWHCCGIKAESENVIDPKLITKDIPNFEINDLLEWKVNVEDNQVVVFVNGTQVSSKINLEKFSDPVFYIGYKQSEDCDGSCPINIELCNINITENQTK